MVSLMLIFGVATGVFLLLALGSRSTKRRGAGGDGDAPWVHGSGGAEFGDSSGCSDGSSGADGGGCGDGGGGGGGE
jgi:hypothetical protein